MVVERQVVSFAVGDDGADAGAYAAAADDGDDDDAGDGYRIPIYHCYAAGCYGDDIHLAWHWVKNDDFVVDVGADAEHDVLLFVVCDGDAANHL